MRALLVGLLAAILLSTGTAVAGEPAKPLLDAYQAELRDAKKIRFGQKVSLAAACVKFSGFTCKKYAPVSVVVRSMTPSEREGWPEGTPTFRLDVVVENRTKATTGLLPKLRCANGPNDGAFYIESVETQSIPAMSRQSGGVIVSFPSAGRSGLEAIQPQQCRDAVIWLKPVSSFDLSAGEAKRAKMFGAAYIPLPHNFLAGLPSSPPTPSD
jgi:hypothetical protein